MPFLELFNPTGRRERTTHEVTTDLEAANIFLLFKSTRFGLQRYEREGKRVRKVEDESEYEHRDVRRRKVQFVLIGKGKKKKVQKKVGLQKRAGLFLPPFSYFSPLNLILWRLF